MTDAADTLDLNALTAILPHRGINLLIDRVERSADGLTATSTVTIGHGDALGRELIGRRDGRGQPVWGETFIAEFLALTGITLVRARMPAEQEAVFSMLSRIVMAGHAGLYDELTGTTTITRERGGFTVFLCRAMSGGRTVLEAEVMSGAGSLAGISAQPVRPFATPPALTALPAGVLDFKAPALRFVDGIVSADAASGKLVAAYRYPTDHAFVTGHFPAASLMMGMCQWQAVADAAWVARKVFGLSGNVLASGRIVRDSGAEILDVRDLLLADDHGTPRIAAAKRVAFREPVRPGDEILIEVNVTPAVA